jgi:proteic killer suppression protein
MIKTWKHKGLKQFYDTGSKAGIRPEHAKRLTMILQFLDVATKPEDINLPKMQFHCLGGDLADYYAVSVNGNWRVIFQFEGQDAILVDYLDYH